MLGLSQNASCRGARNSLWGIEFVSRRQTRTAPAGFVPDGKRPTRAAPHPARASVCSSQAAAGPAPSASVQC